MSISIIIVILLAFIILICSTMPFNKIRILFFSIFPCALITLIIWLLDRYFINFQISYSVGYAFKDLFINVFKFYDNLTTRGLITNVSLIMLFLMVLLISTIIMFVLSKLSLGRPPYIVTGGKVTLHIFYSILVFASYSFLIILIFSGLRNAFYIEDGFLGAVLEAFIPYKGVLA